MKASRVERRVYEVMRRGRSNMLAIWWRTKMVADSALMRQAAARALWAA